MSSITIRGVIVGSSRNNRDFPSNLAATFFEFASKRPTRPDATMRCGSSSNDEVVSEDELPVAGHLLYVNQRRGYINSFEDHGVAGVTASDLIR